MYEWLAECVSRTTALCKKSLGENVAVEPEATSSGLRQCHLVRKHAICRRTVDAEHHTHTYYLGASAGRGHTGSVGARSGQLVAFRLRLAVDWLMVDGGC